MAQRFARHVSPLTSTVYTHPSDQEMWERRAQVHMLASGRSPRREARPAPGLSGIQ